MGEMMPIPDGCPGELFEVMKQCWNHKASDRPKFAALEGELRGLAL